MYDVAITFNQRHQPIVWTDANGQTHPISTFEFLRNGKEDFLKVFEKVETNGQVVKFRRKRRTIKQKVEEFMAADPRNISTKETEKTLWAHTQGKKHGAIYLKKVGTTWRLCYSLNFKRLISVAVGSQRQGYAISSNVPVWVRAWGSDWEANYENFVQQVKESN